MRARPSSTFEWLIPASTGLAGTLTWRIDDGTDNTIDGPSTDDIVELGATGQYVATLTAPSSAGDYVLLSSTDGSFDAGTVYAGQLTVTSSLAEPASPSGRDLCTVADVTSYVPGYRADDTTDAKLQQLITSESDLIHEETAREIIGLSGHDTRVFPILYRRVPIGDLTPPDDATNNPLEVTFLDIDGNELAEATGYTLLYRLARQPTQAWEPVTAIELQSIGGPFLQVTGTWGYPSVPPFVREKCAARVIMRYLSDVASVGTSFAEAAANINLGPLFASARDAIDLLQQPMIS